MKYVIAALYQFTPLTDLPALRREWHDAFKSLDLCGTLLVAPEGINGTLAGSDHAVDQMLKHLTARTGLSRDDVKFSAADTRPFKRLKVRLKQEIITFKQPGANPNINAGTYVAPKEWNRLLEDPTVLLLDTRNTYETMIGTFEGAAVPPIQTFTEFATYVREHLDPKSHKKIAMFCTGGIRCEKASAFMRAEGFSEVYHLKGGILKYLEDVPENQSRWNGECYVFDRRMAVGHGLTTGHYSMCFKCGFALNEADMQHDLFEEGVSCAHCHATSSDDDKARYRMRQQQVGGKLGMPHDKNILVRAKSQPHSVGEIDVL